MKEMPPGMMKAKEDGYDPRLIKREYGTHSYAWEVNVPCDKCGRIIKMRVYKRGQHICKYCRHELKKIAEKTDEELEERILELNPYIPRSCAKEKAFNKAADEVLKQARPKDNYKSAIRVARTRQNDYGSIPEAMVAIELLRLGYKIVPQQKVSSYRVDFAIPKQKIVVEVDGRIYHSHRKDKWRDYSLRCNLGHEWEIVHVPAEEIAKNIHLMKKIMINAVHRGRKNMI